MPTPPHPHPSPPPPPIPGPQIVNLEAAASNKDRMISGMQKSHEEHLGKMVGLAEGRTQHWQQQKAEMERHYTQLLAEIHARQKVKDYNVHTEW